MPSDPLLLAAWVVIPLLVAAFVATLLISRRQRLQGDAAAAAAARAAAPEAPRKRAVVIVNPTKVDDVDQIAAHVRETCARYGWAEPAVIATTAEQTGTEQARTAVADGADLVCALGGDGTVRAVAEGLAGTSTPLGLLAGGTGNLLARNIGLPFDKLDTSLDIALTGQDTSVDVGRLRVDTDGTGTQVRDFVYLVMAGMGFDARIMGGAPEQLKAKVGWPAYVVSGMRHLRGERFKATVTVGADDTAEVYEHRARTVVVGNCGKLLAGITLLPDAKVDDGLLDCVVLSPKTLAGWVAVSSRVVRKTTADNDRVDHYTATEFTVRTAKPEPVQLDGDVVGDAREIRCQVWPGALLVRTPR